MKNKMLTTMLDLPGGAPRSDPVAAFVEGIYREHLGEGGGLYEQWRVLHGDPEVTWKALGDFEDRAEAHLDGLVVGGDLALEVCRQQVREGDFGGLYAATRVFCRQERLDLMLEVLDALDPEGEERVQAVSDALKHERPAAWTRTLVEKLHESNPGVVSIAAQLVGYQRIKAGAELLQVLSETDPEVLPTVIWALGRLHEAKACAPLYNAYLQHEDEAVRTAAALALLRLGEPSTVRYCLGHAPSEEWALLPVGLGGGRSHVPTFIDIASSGDPTPDGLLALGLLGDISAVELLLYSLGDTHLAETAALALNLITGAELYEEVFVPEEIDEDELFEEELERLRRGEPLFPPGEEPGTEITRLSRDPQAWRAWWDEHEVHFRAGIRYRNGKPCAPTHLLENLTSEKSPRRVRQLAYEELVIRYGIDVPFETDMLVAQQQRALGQFAKQVGAEGRSFQEGRWYFAGQMLLQ